MDYSKYIDKATKRQAEIIKVIEESGSKAKAAFVLGISESTINRTLRTLVSGSKPPIKKGGRMHIMLPDMQVTPETPTDHLTWIGKYVQEMKPDVFVNIGDFADMESLSSFDVGKKKAEGKRVIKDIDYTVAAMEKLMKPIKCNPELHLTLGNHEYRINRAIESDAKLDGFLTTDSLQYKSFGWKVYPFLKPVEIDGISYCHYFYNPSTGRPYGGKSIITRINNIGFSFSMGHQQGYQSGIKELNNGRILRGLIAGSGYLHDEDYIGYQGNGHWRGIIVKHEVFDGNYDLMEVSLDYLCRKYEGMPVAEFMKAKYPKIYENSVWLQRLSARYKLQPSTISSKHSSQL